MLGAAWLEFEPYHKITLLPLARSFILIDKY